MRREDFTIDGIPDGYVVYDVDLTPSGRPVAALSRKEEHLSPLAFGPSGECIPVPAPPRPIPRLLPVVRAAGEDRVVALWSVANRDDEITAWIWGWDGQRRGQFAGGMGVEEVMANDRFILTFYGDQAREERVEEGICIFSSRDGKYLWSQGRKFPEAIIMVWFHGAAWASNDEAAVWADVNRQHRFGCAYVLVNIASPKQKIFETSPGWSIPHALTTLGDRVLVYGASSHEYEPGNVTEDQIISWKPGTNDWEVVGSYDGHLRGLPGGRFIAPKPDGYTILSFD